MRNRFPPLPKAEPVDPEQITDLSRFVRYAPNGELPISVGGLEVARFTEQGLRGLEVASFAITTGRTFTNSSPLDLDALTGGAGSIPAVAVTVEIGASGRALVMLTAYNLENSGTGGYTLAGYRVSGATTIGAGGFIFTPGLEGTRHRSSVQDGLNPGTNTFEVQAWVAVGTGTIHTVTLGVIPL